MKSIIDKPTMMEALAGVDLLAAMERAFIAYSAGRAVVPPVGELFFADPPGDVHIKYGYVRGEETYVVKIASGFYENPVRFGLPSSNGLMLVFQQATGVLRAVLLDEGWLTDVRTAAAGAVAARALAPPEVRRIGIVGTGIQARLQLGWLARVTPCREVMVWGRTPAHVARYREAMAAEGFSVGAAPDVAALATGCDLIVTTTPSAAPLLMAADVRPGTHITAVGADSAGKQELEAALLGRADRVVGDSLAQCRERGEIAHALRAGVLEDAALVELGDVLAGRVAGRPSPEAITVCDLTGVAVQDVAIATAVCDAVAREHD